MLPTMKPINWNSTKNQQLVAQRGISFEDIVFYMQQGQLLDDIQHPNSVKYSEQRIFVVNVDNYVHLVPYIENQQEIFLKTVIPSRKVTKQSFGEKS